MSITKALINILKQGSGCCAVGRAVATDTREPGFESSHWQPLLNIYLLLTVCRKIKKKRPGMAHFLKQGGLDQPQPLFVSIQTDETFYSTQQPMVGKWYELNCRGQYCKTYIIWLVGSQTRDCGMVGTEQRIN